MNKQKPRAGKTRKLFILAAAILIILISAAIAAAQIDLVSPENNLHTNQQNISFEFYSGLENTTECSLIIDSQLKTSQNSSQGLNTISALIGPGNHTWKINCSNQTATEASTQRNLVIDVIEPTIVIVSPENNTRINTSQAEISFITVNTPAAPCNCTLIMASQATTISREIIAQDSQTTAMTTPELDDGIYNWHLNCTDQAGNRETTSPRTLEINTTEPEPEFIIELERTSITTGQNTLMNIDAPQGTSIRIEVCPDQPGFVECEIAVTGENIMNYPFQEYLPFTNHEGAYLLEAFFNKSGQTSIINQEYHVQSDLELSIETDDNPMKNVPFILEAEADGGLGELNYAWELSNGSASNKKTINMTYTEPGNYTEQVSVKDQYNNTRNKSISFQVSNTHKIIIEVKDHSTEKALKGATVEIEDQEKITDTNGKAEFYLREKRSDITVLYENYSIHHDELNITKQETFTIYLQKITEQENKPEISLISPDNQSTIQGPDNQLVFKAAHDKSLNCSVYINEDNDGFFINLGTVQLEPDQGSKEQVFGVTELENKTYWWKVECTDPDAISGMSPTWQFQVGNNAEAEISITQTQEDSQEAAGYNDWIDEYEAVLDQLEAMPKDAQEAAEILKVRKTVEKTILAFKNTIRDLNSLNYRTDLTAQEEQKERDEFMLRAEEAYLAGPVEFELIKTSTFVDYIDDEELESLAQEYLEATNQSKEYNAKKMFSYLKELQQEIVLSTKTYQARIVYKDGTSQEYTIISRDIKTYNLTGGSFILEKIPKELAEDASEIISSQDYDIIRQDPIISFEIKEDTTISYYFEKRIDEKKLQNIKTAVFAEPSSIDPTKITGFSISHGLKGIGSIIGIPLIIIILGGMVFVSVRYNGLDVARYTLHKIHGKKSLHYISVILTDIDDNLEAGNYEKAAELYKEAQEAYSELSTIARNEIYPQVIEANNKIHAYMHGTQSPYEAYETHEEQEDSAFYQAEHQKNIQDLRQEEQLSLLRMINNIQDMLGRGELAQALEEYKSIEHAYNQLDSQTREKLHPALVNLGNKIQIIVDNTQDNIRLKH